MVGRILPLRHDAFEPELAGVGEHGRAVALNVLVEPNAWAGLRQGGCERRLADFQRRMDGFFLVSGELGRDGRREQRIESGRVVPELQRAVQGGSMKALLKVDDGTYDDLIAHLLPSKNEQEQAAFVFARVARAL